MIIFFRWFLFTALVFMFMGCASMPVLENTENPDRSDQKIGQESPENPFADGAWGEAVDQNP